MLVEAGSIEDTVIEFTTPRSPHRCSIVEQWRLRDRMRVLVLGMVLGECAHVDADARPRRRVPRTLALLPLASPAARVASQLRCHLAYTRMRHRMCT